MACIAQTWAIRFYGALCLLCSLLHESSNCVHNGGTVVWVSSGNFPSNVFGSFSSWRNRPAAVFAPRLFTGASWDASNFLSCGKQTSVSCELEMFPALIGSVILSWKNEEGREKMHYTTIFAILLFTPSIFAIELLKINRISRLKISGLTPNWSFINKSLSL